MLEWDFSQSIDRACCKLRLMCLEAFSDPEGIDISTLDEIQKGLEQLRRMVVYQNRKLPQKQI